LGIRRPFSFNNGFSKCTSISKADSICSVQTVLYSETPVTYLTVYVSNNNDIRWYVWDEEDGRGAADEFTTA